MPHEIVRIPRREPYRLRAVPAKPAAVRLNMERASTLREVAGDWLYEHCSTVGREKLLREHDLLAA